MEKRKRKLKQKTKQKWRDINTIIKGYCDEIFGNISYTGETSGVVKLKQVVVSGFGNYGKVGYWVKDLFISYGWRDSEEEKGWTYCETRNQAKRVRARNKTLSIEKDKQHYWLWGYYEQKHWFNSYKDVYLTDDTSFSKWYRLSPLDSIIEEAKYKSNYEKKKERHKARIGELNAHK